MPLTCDEGDYVRKSPRNVQMGSPRTCREVGTKIPARSARKSERGRHENQMGSVRKPNEVATKTTRSARNPMTRTITALYQKPRLRKQFVFLSAKDSSDIRTKVRMLSVSKQSTCGLTTLEK